MLLSGEIRLSVTRIVASLQAKTEPAAAMRCHTGPFPARQRMRFPDGLRPEMQQCAGESCLLVLFRIGSLSAQPCAKAQNLTSIIL